jgi:hypothetical protein
VEPSDPKVRGSKYGQVINVIVFYFKATMKSHVKENIDSFKDYTYFKDNSGTVNRKLVATDLLKNILLAPYK